MSATSTLKLKSRNGKVTRSTTASKVSDEVLKDICEVFKMLADTNRLKILLALAKQGEMHVTALCELVTQSQPAVSHHLTLMRGIKLVVCRRDGKHNFYRLNSSRLSELLEEFFADTGNAQKQMKFEDFLLSYKKN